MVWLASETESKYPYIRKYYNEVFPHVQSRSSIFDPWLKYGDLEDAGAGQRTLSFVKNKGPELRFESGSGLGCNFYQATNLGGTQEKIKEGQQNKLLIGMTWAMTVSARLTLIAEELGELSNASLMYYFDKNKIFSDGHRNVIRLLEATTLHELIHWSYYRSHGSNGPNEEEKRWKGDPEGGTSRFEREAYGQIVGFDWHTVCKETLVEPSFGWVLKYVSPGPIVDYVLPYGSASNSGILEGDIIISIDGNKIITDDYLDNFKKTTKVGTSVLVEIQSGNKLLGNKPRFVSVYFSADKQGDALKRAGLR